MPKYFNGLRTEGGIFGNEADNWNNEHQEEAERLKGGTYRLQKKNEFIPVEDIQSRRLNPEEELIAKEESKKDEDEEENLTKETDKEKGMELWPEYPVDDQKSVHGGEDEKSSEEYSVKLSQLQQKYEDLPKKEPINPEQSAGWDAKKYNPNYWAHGKRGRKREWPKSLKARERFNEIERKSLEKAKEIE